jgi:hypothetical protein
MKIELDLTDDEIENLEEALEESDSGPSGHGWRSEERMSLSDKVDEAIELARQGQ